MLVKASENFAETHVVLIPSSLAYKTNVKNIARVKDTCKFLHYNALKGRRYALLLE